MKEVDDAKRKKSIKNNQAPQHVLEHANAIVKANENKSIVLSGDQLNSSVKSYQDMLRIGNFWDEYYGCAETVGVFCDETGIIGYKNDTQCVQYHVALAKIAKKYNLMNCLLANALVIDFLMKNPLNITVTLFRFVNYDHQFAVLNLAPGVKYQQVKLLENFEGIQQAVIIDLWNEKNPIQIIEEYQKDIKSFLKGRKLLIQQNKSDSLEVQAMLHIENCVQAAAIKIIESSIAAQPSSEVSSVKSALPRQSGNRTQFFSQARVESKEVLKSVLMLLLSCVVASCSSRENRNFHNFSTILLLSSILLFISFGPRAIETCRGKTATTKSNSATTRSEQAPRPSPL